MTKPTQAAATRWFNAHVGQTIYTHQTTYNGGVWEPGPRTLELKGRTRWMLDGSGVTFSSEHTILYVGADRVTIALQIGDRVQTTTYSTTNTFTD